MSEAVLSVDSLDRSPDVTLVQEESAVLYPAVSSVTASGPLRRPAALGLLLRFQRPMGSRFLPKQV
jgi:hypothetical protein